MAVDSELEQHVAALSRTAAELESERARAESQARQPHEDRLASLRRTLEERRAKVAALEESVRQDQLELGRLRAGRSRRLAARGLVTGLILGIGISALSLLEQGGARAGIVMGVILVLSLLARLSGKGSRER